MKNKYTIIPTLLFIISLAFTACSDWAEIENIAISEPKITEQNPELYAQYLENLRAYKKSEHKSLYVWYDNSVKVPFNRVQHLTQLPDSIDFISLMFPDHLVEREISEIETIRKEKGTKVIYTINFEDIKVQYNGMHSLAKDSEPIAVDFISFMVDSLQYALSLAGKYNYDGICISYTGKGALHMTTAEKTEYIANENTFIGILNDWHERHTDKSIIFTGKPQNVINRKLLADCDLIIVSCLDAKNKSEFTLNAQMAIAEGIPAERFAISVSTPSSDTENKEVGYFADGTVALTSVAEWCASSYSEFSVAGIAIYNVNSDYYNPSRTFRYTREIINALNPSIKH